MDGEGHVRAYVGGSSYAERQFDRATTAARGGLLLGDFVYLTVVDEPVKIGTWEPKNYAGRFL